MARNSNGPTTRKAHQESSRPLVATQLASMSAVTSSASSAIQMTIRCTMLPGRTPLTTFSPFVRSAIAFETYVRFFHSVDASTAMYEMVAETLATATIGLEEIPICQVTQE